MNDYVGFKKIAESYFEMTMFGGKDSPPLKKQGLILTFDFTEIEYSTFTSRYRAIRPTDNGYKEDGDISLHGQETIRVQLSSDINFSCIGESKLIDKFSLLIAKPDNRLGTEDAPHQVSVRIKQDGRDYPSDASINVWLTLPDEEFSELKRKIIHNEIDSGFIRFTIPESAERVFSAPFKQYPINDFLSQPDKSLQFTTITYPYKLIPDNYSQLWEGVSPAKEIRLDEYEIGLSKTITSNNFDSDKKAELTQKIITEAYNKLLMFGADTDEE